MVKGRCQVTTNRLCSARVIWPVLATIGLLLLVMLGLIAYRLASELAYEWRHPYRFLVADAYVLSVRLERYYRAHGDYPSKSPELVQLGNATEQYFISNLKRECARLGHPVRRVRVAWSESRGRQAGEVLVLEAKGGRVVFYSGGKVGISLALLKRPPPKPLPWLRILP